ncbi:MAG TPA: gluconate 2-dehydrogenase subunit 3 family protein [Bryobacteraceae bacterium]|nr:gluconate 2-dehydrogenase subunit 3 family protein [Bryobacteraceae bacterium]
MKRRTFFTAGVALTASACGRPFFTAQETRTLEALCAAIIPDDQDPGAIRGGVVNYIATQLRGLYRPLRKTYREGLAAFAAEGFANLSSNDQVKFLTRIDQKPHLKPFFDLLVAHTMQGFYGDPRHGGNRDRVSWKMLGIPYPPLRGRQKDVG